MVFSRLSRFVESLRAGADRDIAAPAHSSVRVGMERPFVSVPTVSGARQALDSIRTGVRSIQPSPEVDAVAKMVNRYIIHGHTPTARRVVIEQDTADAVPSATVVRDLCDIRGIRMQYDKLIGSAVQRIEEDRGEPSRQDLIAIVSKDRNGRYLKMVERLAEPLMRAVSLIHEDAHARTESFLKEATMNALGIGTKSLEKQFFMFEEDGYDRSLAGFAKTHVAEHISDAMSILMIARRDGIEKGIEVADFIAGVRSPNWPENYLELAHRERRLPIELLEKHDTSTMAANMARSLREGKVPDSDHAAWKTAVETGLSHAMESARRQFTDLGLSFSSAQRAEAVIASLRHAADLSVQAYSDPSIKPRPLESSDEQWTDSRRRLDHEVTVTESGIKSSPVKKPLVAEHLIGMMLGRKGPPGLESRDDSVHARNARHAPR